MPRSPVHSPYPPKQAGARAEAPTMNRPIFGPWLPAAGFRQNLRK
ncbi:MAG TPA: hypothetical protein VF326_04665 [Anaerolineaceae bacterium]